MAFWRKRDRDLDEEIASHLRMAENDWGKDAARKEFGNVGLVKEVTRSMWGWASWDRLAQDVRYAFRVLRKNPGYALTAVLSLALGIGANTAIFSLIDAVMLQSLPVKNARELVSVGEPSDVQRLSEGGTPNVRIFSYPFYQRFREQNQIFRDVYATGRAGQLTIDNTDEHPQGRFVSDNFFSVLGVQPLRGRTFASEDQSAIVISYDYWQRRFQGDPGILGRKLRINGAGFTMIGVAPPEFFGDVVGYETDLWIPLQAQPDANPGRNFLNNRKAYWLLLMGRLKPGVSLAQASAVTNTLGQDIMKDLVAQASPSESMKELARERIAVQPAAAGFSRIRRNYSKPLLMLMGLVLLVLLICGTNVANLQLARASSRGREIGLRLAIGATRGRLLRQLLTESLLLATMGGVAGLFLANWMGHLLLQWVARDHRLPMEPHLSGMALLFTVAIAVFSGLLFGLAPALYATKGSVVASLKESKSGRAHRGAQRFEKGLVVFQIVLSWVLLFGSGLFIRTLQNLETADVGYRRDHLLIVELDPVAAGYQDSRMNQLSRRLLDKLDAMPGATSVTISENGLFSGTDSTSGDLIEGYTARSPADKENRYDRVGPHYFETLGTPILAGRGIEEQDIDGAPRVAVINEAMARFYFAHADPLGRHIGLDSGKEPAAIVGVVRDAKQNNLRDPAARRYYLPYLQHLTTDPLDGMRIEIRTQLPGTQMADSIRRGIKSVDPNLQIQSINAAQLLIEDELMQERMIAKLSSSFSLLALILASVGLYGVMSYLMQRRTVEIGIRMALGATKAGVVNMVLREALALAVAGLMIGIVVAVFAGKLISSALYGLASFDPLTVTIASVMMFAAAVLAGWLPARRAARVDPMVALRAE